MVNGEVVEFDSRKEAHRFDELYLLLKAKKIAELRLQPCFPLMEKQVHGDTTYRAVSYNADFQYIQDGKTIVEDVKSEATKKDKTYMVKVKWFLSIYGKDILFKEV